jgi:hypothetical protein
MMVIHFVEEEDRLRFGLNMPYDRRAVSMHNKIELMLRPTSFPIKEGLTDPGPVSVVWISKTELAQKDVEVLMRMDTGVHKQCPVANEVRWPVDYRLSEALIKARPDLIEHVIDCGFLMRIDFVEDRFSAVVIPTIKVLSRAFAQEAGHHHQLVVTGQDCAFVKPGAGLDRKVDGAQAFRASVDEVASEDDFPGCIVGADLVDMRECRLEGVCLAVNIANGKCRSVENGSSIRGPRSGDVTDVGHEIFLSPKMWVQRTGRTHILEERKK